MAALGLLGAHQVSYERLAESSGEHAGMTFASQSWLPSLPSILFTLSVAAFLVVLRSRQAPGRLPGPAAVLVTQFGLFLVLEVVDRVLHGCCVFPDAEYLALALALQVPTALLSWTLTRFGVLPAVSFVVAVLSPLGHLASGSVRSQADLLLEGTAPSKQLRALAESVSRRGPPALCLAG